MGKDIFSLRMVVNMLGSFRMGSLLDMEPIMKMRSKLQKECGEMASSKLKKPSYRRKSNKPRQKSKRN